MASPGSIHSTTNSSHSHSQHHHIEIPASSHSPSTQHTELPREHYPDHSPSRHTPHRTTTSTQNQLDQDVQAALHFSRARAGTLNNNTPPPPPSSYPHDHQLLWSNRDLLRGVVTPDPSSQFTQVSSTPLALHNPQALHLLHLQHQHPLGSPHNQFHHLHRSLSDHSLDSSHGAFIDHRPTHIHPSPISRSTLPPISPSPDHHHHPSELNHSHTAIPQLTPLFQSPCNLIDDSLPPSLSAPVSTDSHHFLPNPNLRPPQLNQEEIRDSLAFLAHDSSNRTPIRNRIPSHPSIQVSDPQNPQNFNMQLPDNDGSCAATSPRPSQAEEDVCFPTLEADRPMSKDQQQPMRLDDQKLIAMGHERGTAGMLPHFPFPFNFQALEEFAQAERETLNLMRNRQILRDPYPNSSQTPGLQPSRTNRSNEADEIVPFTDEEENPIEEDFSAMKDSAMRRRKVGFLSPSVDKTDESAISDRRTVSGTAVGSSLGGRMGGILNQRRLSENIRPISSAQRKLALFEGAGHNLLNGFSFGSTEAGSGISGPGGSLKASGGIESRAPLLGSRLNRFPFGGGGGGDGGGSKPHQVRWMNNNERPYRFSFYSNALPSTIHARSLAEIPGEGQTFEDLFVGRSNNGTPSTGKTTDQDPTGPLHQQKDVFSSSQNPDLSKTTSPLNDLIHIPPVTKNPNAHSPRTDKFDPNTNDLLSDAQMASMGEPLKRSSPIPPPQQQQQESHSNNNNNRKQRTGVLMRTDEDAEANTWWLDVLSPTDQEMKLLSKVFGIHPLTTEDILMEETREKIELFRNYYLVCFRSFDQDPYSPTYLEPLNIYIIVFREGTLSFHFRAVSHPQNVRRRIKQLKDYINVTSDWISYALIDDITDAFGPLIQSIEYEVDSIDELVLILKDVEQSDMLRRIGTCRKKVMGLLRLMGNKADVVKGLAKRCNENWLVAPKSDIGLYLSDIQDHLVTMTQNLNHYEKILSRSHSNYLAQISIEMTDANNQINDVLSKLTALGSILVPMNLVTGLWGMNVHVPGQDVTEGYAWFIAIVCALVSFGIIGAWLTLRYFKFSNR